MNADVVQRVKVLAEIFGKTMSDPAARYFCQGLSNYPAAQVLRALDRCLAECRRFPAIAEIVERLDDGRPSVNEAWAMIPRSESDSVVWTDEISQAFYVALPLLNDGNETQAFFAFKERYEALLSDARIKGQPAKWTPSLGHSKHGRTAVLQAAVDKGRLSLERAVEFAPELEFKGAKVLSLPQVLKQIPQLDEPEPKGHA